VCARRRSNFLLLRQKKVTKEKATLLCVTPSLRCGATCGARSWGVPQNSLRACGAPFKQLRQVSSRRRVSCGTRPPHALRSSARTEGNPGGGHPYGPSLRSAPSRGRKRLALRRLGRAQRWPVWLLGCSFPTPIWLRLRRGGCGVAGVPQDTPASLTDSPWLFERRAAGAKRVPRRTPQPPRRRFAPKGSQTVGRLSFGYVSLAKQRKVPRPPGRDPASAPCRSTLNASKKIAASAITASVRAQKHTERGTK